MAGIILLFSATDDISSSLFLIFDFIEYHVSVILSQRRDTLYYIVSHRRHYVCVIVSRRHNMALTEVWYHSCLRLGSNITSTQLLITKVEKE